MAGRWRRRIEQFEIGPLIRDGLIARNELPPDAVMVGRLHCDPTGPTFWIEVSWDGPQAASAEEPE